MNVLRIDSSAKRDGSKSRALTDRLIRALGADIDVVTRDLSHGIPQIDQDWVTANTTPEGERTPAQRRTLALSDTLIAELEAADTIIIGVPVYNFGVPASLKAWIDQVCRARRTFVYADNGPVGLLTGKRAIVVHVSGGTAFGAEIDFASGYMRHILGFIGITDVRFVTADRHFKLASRLEAAQAEVEQIARDLAA